MPSKNFRPGRILPWFLLVVMGTGVMVEGARGDQHKTLIDFGAKEDGVQMGITNDGVMGGLSKGKVGLTANGTAEFYGTLSLENNGGFSSLRMEGGDWNLEGWKGVVLKVRGDGRTYDLRLTTDARFRGSAVSFRAPFKTVENKWTTVKIPFAELRAGWRGRDLDTPFVPMATKGIGVTLADKKAGPFRIEMQWIKAWR